MTAGWMHQHAPEIAPDPFVVRLRPGADRRGFRDELAKVTGGSAQLPEPPSAVSNLARIRGLPYALEGAIALLALGALIHALVLSVRRHRRQLAVLRTLGFTRRQVSAAVASHATSLAAAATAIGLPLGVVLGRLGWRVVADRLGVEGEPLMPLLPLVVGPVIVVVAANLIAAYPAWLARRGHPAVSLRAE